jgi:hypothetical protein
MKLKFLVALVGVVVVIAMLKHMYMSHMKAQSPMAKATKWMGGYSK